MDDSNLMVRDVNEVISDDILHHDLMKGETEHSYEFIYLDYPDGREPRIDSDNVIKLRCRRCGRVITPGPDQRGMLYLEYKNHRLLVNTYDWERMKESLPYYQLPDGTSHFEVTRILDDGTVMTRELGVTSG